MDSTHLAGWDVIQAKVVGRWAASDWVILSEVLAQLLSYPPSQLRRRLIALTESIAAGAASAIVESLLLLTNREIAPEHLRCLNTLLVQCVPSLAPTEQERLAQWLAPIAATQLEWIHPIVDLLSDVAPTARNLLEQHLKDLPEAKQNQLRQQLLRFKPIEQHPPLHQLNKVTQRSLLNLYRQQAATQAIARDRVLEVVQYRMKDIALAASQDLAQVCGVELTAAQLLPLLQSIFPGVRVNGLSAIIDRATESQWLSSIQVSEISQQLAQEPNQTVVRRFCDLIAVWVRHHQIVPAGVIATLAAIPARLAASQQLEGGTGRSLLNALKAIAQSTDATVDAQGLGVAVCQLLSSIRSIQIRNSESEMIDLLCAMHRLDETFVRQIVQTECPQLVQKGWHPNVAIVIKTIARIESQYSPLLNWLLSVDWCTPEMRSVILEVRGG